MRLIASSRFSEFVFRAQNSCSLSRPPQCPARAAEMRVRERAIAALALLCACFTVAHARETFVEEVLLQRLPDDVVVAVFTFTQTAPTDARHYTVMSKPLASVLAHSNAHELELSFGRHVTRRREACRCRSLGDVPERRHRRRQQSVDERDDDARRNILRVSERVEYVDGGDDACARVSSVERRRQSDYAGGRDSKACDASARGGVRGESRTLVKAVTVSR